eukprot:g18594.t1
MGTEPSYQPLLGDSVLLCIPKSTLEDVYPKIRCRMSLTPPEGCCPGLERFAQAIRECVNTRFISCSQKVVQNITQVQRNAIRALKTNRDIVIKPADKGGAIATQNRTDYCREAYRQLNNQEHYRHLPADPTKEQTHQLNRLVKIFDSVLQSTLRIHSTYFP